MGVIRQLKNFFTGKIIYPKTLTKAVYDENGERLDKILRDTMLATDSEEYNGVEPRDADTLGGKYKSDDITAIKEKVNEINSSLELYGSCDILAKDISSPTDVTINNINNYKFIVIMEGTLDSSIYGVSCVPTFIFKNFPTYYYTERVFEGRRIVAFCKYVNDTTIKCQSDNSKCNVIGVK